MTMSTHQNEDEKEIEPDGSLVPAVIESDGSLVPVSGESSHEGLMTSSAGTTLMINEDFLSFVDALEKAGYDDRDRAMKAIEAGKHFGIRPLRALLRSGVPLETLERAAWIKQGYETVDVTLAMVDRDRFAQIPIASAKRLVAVPLKTDDDHLRIAVADPTNIDVLDDIEQLFVGEDIELVVAEPAAIRDVLTILEARGRTDEIQVDLDKVQEEVTIKDSGSDGKIARLVNTLVENAAQQGASDIHIEPDGTDVLVRYRIDGVLHIVTKYPIATTSGIINRLKVIGGLDVGERRVPQDGRFDIEIEHRAIDIRLVTLPTSWGVEGAVMRLLDRGSKVAKLEDLGYSQQVLDSYIPLITATQGTLLATGPTGSGKTTTLYATLERIATPDIKVLTVEDPVEYRFQGITQVQVNTKAGMTFPRALRAFMRADPDVILVGEMRDGETASIGIQAALTGHFVLSTVHANSASAVPTRLIDMGVEPFLVASSLRGVISQRLVRKLCDKCYEPIKVSDAIKRAFPWIGDPPKVLYKAHEEGCGHCHRTGYTGRTTLAEVLHIDDDIAQLISRNATAHEVEALAVQSGMVTILQDGLTRAAQGITSIDELSRVVG
ncbi:MAG TPA: GspE/PulE family protein [Acidimicrobiia bacterium]|nr:GspE/PulE family protein [Acidimicrobiia bacterium]